MKITAFSAGVFTINCDHTRVDDIHLMQLSADVLKKKSLAAEFGRGVL